MKSYPALWASAVALMLVSTSSLAGTHHEHSAQSVTADVATIEQHNVADTHHALKGLRGRHNHGAHDAQRYYKEFAREVALTDAQRAQIEASIVSGVKATRYDLRERNHPNRNKLYSERKKAIAKFKRDVASILTPEQMVQAEAFYETKWAKRVAKRG